MNDLRPATLELGLYPVVEWQVRQFERMSAIRCRLSPEVEFTLDESRTLAVFRILQEALTNIARHAEASEVAIVLRQDAHGFAITVQDNGKGLRPDEHKKRNSTSAAARAHAAVDRPRRRAVRLSATAGATPQQYDHRRASSAVQLSLG